MNEYIFEGFLETGELVPELRGEIKGSDVGGKLFRISLDQQVFGTAAHAAGSKTLQTQLCCFNA